MQKRIYLKLTKRALKGRGFTLIETLLVVSLLSVISIGVFKVLSSGLRLWERGKQFKSQEDSMIFIEKISRDLRNTVNVSTLAFAGNSNSVVIPTLVKVRADQLGNLNSDGYVIQPGRVSYSFDSQKFLVERSFANYGQAQNQQFSVAATVAEEIRDLSFYYYYIESGRTKVYKQVQDGIIPSAVRIELWSKDQQGNDLKVSRLILVPLGA